MEKEDLQISVTQAARLLKSSGKTVVNYCLSGKLEGEKNSVTGVWKISLNSVRKLLRKKTRSTARKAYDISENSQ